jgi:hypothetical protein
LLVASQQSGFGSAIAGITAGQDRLAKVQSLYGPGALSKVGDIQSLCYYVESDHAYLSVATFEGDTRVQSITLTTITAAEPGCGNARITGKHLTAAHGITLGDSLANVIGAFGQPSQSGKLPINGQDVSYADYKISNGRATCQFEHGKLILVRIQFN